MSSTSEVSSTSDVIPVQLTQNIPSKCRGLVISGSGTISGTTRKGRAVTDFPVFEGYNKVRFKVINTASEGVNSIWGYF